MLAHAHKLRMAAVATKTRRSKICGSSIPTTRLFLTTPPPATTKSSLSKSVASTHQHRHHGKTPISHSHNTNNTNNTNTNDTETITHQTATQAAKHITKVGIGCNILLGTSKGVLGFACGSVSLMADAVHSFSDLLSDAVTLVTVSISRRLPDTSHPYGYGRYETIGSLAVACLLGGASLGILSQAYHTLVRGVNTLTTTTNNNAATVTESSAATAGNTNLLLESLLGDGSTTAPSALIETAATTLGTLTLPPSSAAMNGVVVAGVLVAGLSVGVKEWLFRRTMQVAQHTRSSVLAANAWHHRSDALSSGVALVGEAGCGRVGGGLGGGGEGGGGAVVSAMIMKGAVEIARDAVLELSDKHSEEQEDVVQRAREVCKRLVDEMNFQCSVGHMRCRRMGHYFLVDMQLVVSPRISVSAAHYKSEVLRSAMVTSLPELLDVLVHIDTEPHSHLPWMLQDQHEQNDQNHQQQKTDWKTMLLSDPDEHNGGPGASPVSPLLLPASQLHHRGDKGLGCEWAGHDLERRVVELVAQKRKDLQCEVASVVGHFIDGAVEAEILVAVPMHKTVREARHIGEQVRDVVLSELGGEVKRVSVHLCLGVWGQGSQLKKCGSCMGLCKQPDDHAPVGQKRSRK